MPGIPPDAVEKLKGALKGAWYKKFPKKEKPATTTTEATPTTTDAKPTETTPAAPLPESTPATEANAVPVAEPAKPNGEVADATGPAPTSTTLPATTTDDSTAAPPPPAPTPAVEPDTSKADIPAPVPAPAAATTAAADAEAAKPATGPSAIPESTTAVEGLSATSGPLGDNAFSAEAPKATTTS